MFIRILPEGWHVYTREDVREHTKVELYLEEHTDMPDTKALFETVETEKVEQ